MIPTIPLAPSEADLVLRQQDIKVFESHYHRGIGNLFITKKDIRWISYQGDGFLVALRQMKKIKYNKDAKEIVFRIMFDERSPNIGFPKNIELVDDTYTISIAGGTEGEMLTILHLIEFWKARNPDVVPYVRVGNNIIIVDHEFDNNGVENEEALEDDDVEMVNAYNVGDGAHNIAVLENAFHQEDADDDADLE